MDKLRITRPRRLEEPAELRQHPDNNGLNKLTSEQNTPKTINIQAYTEEMNIVAHHIQPHIDEVLSALDRYNSINLLYFALGVKF